MRLIRQEFKKNDTVSLLRQTGITLKQHKPHPATSSAFLHQIYFGKIFWNGGW